MKRMFNHIILCITLTTVLLSSCIDDELNESFYPIENLTIADYLEENKDSLALYYQLLDELGYLSSLAAYNPNGNGYTVFVPSDEAFKEFFNSSSSYSSIEALLNDLDYAQTLTLYHIVNTGLLTTDFPFGSLPDTTASGDFLSIAIDTASSLPRINGEAGVLDPNIELTNGYIHIIDKVLLPITFSIGEWLLTQAQFSIMTEAMELCGLMELLNSSDEFTVLLETDEILSRNEIFSLQDLIDKYSPGNTDYTSEENGLYRFVAFHLIEGIYYLDDFEGNSRLYNTPTIYPVDINGEDLIMRINEGNAILDTLITGSDTTIIDYVGFNYENSNNQAINGAVHLIDQLMDLSEPELSQVVNQFFNEPVINSIRNEPGETIFTDQEDFQVIQWTGIEEIRYVKFSEGVNGLWNNDYIILDGAFTMTYEIPRILPGKYNLYIGAHAFSDNNASISLRFDGNSIGGNIDLTSGGTSNNPYFNFLVGTIELTTYDSHTIEVSTLIPGQLICDRFTLEPVE